MNYPDSVQFLYALGNEIKTAKFGLERIQAVLDALGRPQDRCRFIHVAGTNGKGSVCAMLESILRAAGWQTGLYTSPHLNEPTERIRINGAPVSSAQFTEAFNRVYNAVERLLATGAVDLHASYFEMVTAMALVIFADEQPDFVVWETGLGGRLDATNVVRPELCVITPIDFDHEKYLGASLAAIAGEKAGILKPGVPAVFSRQRPEAARILSERAAQAGIEAVSTADWEPRSLELHPAGSRFSLVGHALACPPSELAIECPLPGEHQVENAITAALAARRIGVPDPAIQAGIVRTRWPGRLERISEDPLIILDGAHNPAGARALAAYIARFYSGRPVRMIFGAMRDKAVSEIAGVLFPLAGDLILTAPRQARALAPEALRQIAEHPHARIAPGISEALALGGSAEVTFVTGSLFLVAEARAILARGPLL